MGDDGILLTDQDLYLFNEGSHFHLHQKLGAHCVTTNSGDGVHFAVWAPNAERVSVMGDFNAWDASRHPLRARGSSGVWEGAVPGVLPGARYKYHIASRYNGYCVDKADPCAFRAEVAPGTASIVWSLDYQWDDAAWMAQRARGQKLDAPMAIYEVHSGSWRRVPEDANRSLTYRELAVALGDYVQAMGFTHVELTPIMEHPFYGSWGYQVTGYFAPTGRYGTPQDLMYLIDSLHQRGIGVILDWVPSHFPTDEHGLGFFDGTHLYEHGDPRQGIHPEWNSCIFNYGRHEVRSFLISNAMFWLEAYHADGLRVDAVASMLYLDYGRKPGEWIPNVHGGRENLDAVTFLRRCNEAIFSTHPDVQVIAEESTAWPMVSRPTYVGGLGFGLKWDMGWMHDTLGYLAHDPIHRKYHHNDLTFRQIYAFFENFVLPLSHDEVVYGKGSLLRRMPGDDWQKFANLRLLFGYMYTQPGKKLLFMGGEIAQWDEWNHESSLQWHLLNDAPHQGVQHWMRDLNTCYRAEPALHQLDTEPAGFAWIDCNDADASVLTYIRQARQVSDTVVVACNFTPLPRHHYRIGVPAAGWWREILNSDASAYGGSGHGNLGGVDSTPLAWHGHSQSIEATLPPLSVIIFKAPQ